MDDMSDSWRITDDQAASRLELAAEGQAADVQLAELVYRRSGSRLVLVHTGVPRALEGRGVGGALIRAAVAKAAAEGLTVVPLCPFAKDWLERHPEAAALAEIDLGTGDELDSP
jgi:predicted GNAT family acetyltransferase